jgi:hypothetical protein
MEANVTLYRPTGPKELHLVAESGYRAQRCRVGTRRGAEIQPFSVCLPPNRA